MSKQRRKRKKGNIRPISFKKCKNCGIQKIIHDFAIDSRRLDGYSNICILCKEKFSYQNTPPKKIEKKECRKCKEIKNFSNFRRHGAGFENYCKQCQRKVETEYRKNLSPEQKEENRKKNREYQKEYKKTEQGRKSIRKGNQRYYQKNKDKIRAHSTVRYAVLIGKLPHISTQTCECGQKAENYHHHKGYEREFRTDVVPICKECHSLIIN